VLPALVQRGSITFWLSDDFEKTWMYAGEKQRGSQFDYSEQAILVMLTVKEVFHLTNRCVEGFVRSLFRMMKINLRVPDHSTLSKRGKELRVKLPKKTSQSLNIVMDSTGLKIYGEGEWKVRMHGISKRRTWLKLHIGANPEDGEIQAALLTQNNVSDDAAVEVLLEQIEQEIAEFGADGAYDKRKVYDSLNAHSPDVNILIPPRKTCTELVEVTRASGNTATPKQNVSNETRIYVPFVKMDAKNGRRILAIISVPWSRRSCFVWWIQLISATQAVDGEAS